MIRDGEVKGKEEAALSSKMHILLRWVLETFIIQSVFIKFSSLHVLATDALPGNTGIIFQSVLGGFHL